MFADFYRIPIARGGNAVLMQGTRGGGSRGNHQGVKPFEHIRLRGEDVKEGEPIGRAGEVMHAGRLQLRGRRCGRVSVSSADCRVLATGMVREPGDLGEGGIHESNRLALAELIRETGAEARVYPLVNDTLDATKAALRQAFDECDAVVTSGGVSVGDHDFVKPALEALGGELDFWKVRIKPGKPFGTADCETSRFWRAGQSGERDGDLSRAGASEHLETDRRIRT